MGRVSGGSRNTEGRAIDQTSDSGDPRSGSFLGIAPRQWIKIVVYVLLFLNFFHYLGNDLELARHTVRDDWHIFDWTTAFATTLDESAWFVLLFLFELETYLLDDEAFTRKRVQLMHGVRILCFLFIAHTVYAFADYLWKLDAAKPIENVDLCSLVTEDLSFARNLEYAELTTDNCATLSDDTRFLIFDKDQLITDSAGMRVEIELAWVDILEVLLWLLIVFIIELLVRLQEKNITSGTVLRSALTVKAVAYGLLWCAAAYWAWRGHWVFVWDEALWILGFMAIGGNLSEWRKEIDTAAHARA